MLFHSSLRKELARSFGATFLVVTTVVLTMTLIRTLGQASRGNFNPSDVTMVMGYTVIAYMPTLLSLSLFIAIIATLTRMYRDSEMVIWFCSGEGVISLIKPLLRFSWPIFVVITVLSLIVLPWSNQRIDVLKNQYEARGDLDRIEPGQFQESADGSKVFFVEKNQIEQKKGTNVFIATTERGKETVTSAQSGRVDATSAGKYLMLNNGQRLETAFETNEIKLSKFQEYGTKISNEISNEKDFRFINTWSTLELIKEKSSTALGELAWRLGLILAAFNFVIIGIAISNSNPRTSKNKNQALSILLFIIYLNLINLGQSWISNNRVAISQYLILLHGGMFLIGVAWILKTHFNLNLRLSRQKPKYSK